MKVATLLLIGLGLILPGVTTASILDMRDNLLARKTAAEQALATKPDDAKLQEVLSDATGRLTRFDAMWQKNLGDGWLDRLTNTAYGNDVDEAADIYMEGTTFQHNFKKASRGKKLELLAYIAAKPTLTEADLFVVSRVVRPTHGIYDDALAWRLDDFGALIDDGEKGESYFNAKYSSILGMGGNWMIYMLPEEWIQLAAAKPPYSVATYQAMRDNLLAMATKLLIEKREAAGQPTEGAEFEAALAPVVTALDAPRFSGLGAAVTTLGLDMTIPDLDLTAASESADNVVSLVERHVVSEKKADRILGGVMFMKGAANYATWRESVSVPEPESTP